MGFSTVPCNEFVEVLASKAPVPGGGGASALVGAIGTALGNMVGSLTVGKKKYADVEEEKRPSYFYHDDECFSVCHHKTDDTKKYLMVFPLDVSASYDIAGEHCALADIQQYLTKSEFASQSTTFNRETLTYRTIGMDNVVSITPQDADE